MSETHPPRQVLRSIGAVLAGMVVGIALTLGTDELLHIAGSYIIARLAPNRPMLHALIGGVVGFIVSIVGAVATWNSGPAFGPHWYPLALVITALPTAWAGGKLRLMQLRARPSASTA